METQDLTRLIVDAVSRCQPSITKDAACVLADAIISDILAANFGTASPGVAQPMEPQKSSERRRASRPRVLKGATLVFNGGNCSMNCQVLDLTKTGARLKPEDILLCPKEFTLKFNYGLVHDCEVKWRKGNMLEVRFL